jgi:glucosylceramidase
MITIDNATHKITTSGQYWAYAHYSKHIKRGAKAFATNGLGNLSQSGVSHAGFCNPDGSCVVVLANKGAENHVQLLMGSRTLDLDLPADCVQTLHWM